MRAISDFTRDFIDMGLHSFGVHPWRCDSRARSARRAHHPEQIRIFVSLVRRLAWPSTCSRLHGRPANHQNLDR